MFPVFSPLIIHLKWEFGCDYLLMWRIKKYIIQNNYVIFLTAFRVTLQERRNIDIP